MVGSLNPLIIRLPRRHHPTTLATSCSKGNLIRSCGWSEGLSREGSASRSWYRRIGQVFVAREQRVDATTKVWDAGWATRLSSRESLAEAV